MELTVQNFYGLLLRSRLLPVAEARALFERWQAEARDVATDPDRFLKWLVVNRYLTEYQAGLLSKGHADGFFLNPYKILDRLGKGRMAGVYRGVHELGQVVAIKVLPPSKAKDPPLLARFQREARLALRLKHPNIVRTFQVGRAGELHYLVMEYLEGETLDDVLRDRGRLPPGEAVRLLYQALLGLQHIHEQGLVHRDLKPSNLMLVPAPAPGQPEGTARSTVKILDIGLGRALFDEAAPDRAPDPTLTGEGVVLGTPDYMSPEQARDARGTDIRSDIYSLGCVLYHTLAGQPPFPDSNLISQMLRHATESPRPLREFNPAVPDGLQQIVNWMMAKDPGQRYPTPERAAQALHVFLAAGADAQAGPETDPKMRSYLSWLEDERGKEDVAVPAGPPPTAPSPSSTIPATAAPARPVPAAKPPPTVPGIVAPARATPDAAGPRRQGRKHRRRAPRETVPTAKVAEEFDVELVPSAAPAKGRAPSSAGGFQLTRRDLLMFGIGVGSTLFTILVSWSLARLFSRRAPALPPPENPDSGKE